MCCVCWCDQSSEDIGGVIIGHWRPRDDMGPLSLVCTPWLSGPGFCWEESEFITRTPLTPGGRASTGWIMGGGGPISLLLSFHFRMSKSEHVMSVVSAADKILK